MGNKIIPTPDQLRNVLSYEPETGMLFWKFRDESMFKSKQNAAAWNGRNAYKEALTSGMIGYMVGTIFGGRYLAHRVAWAIHYGKWPEDQIDHINGNRSDNRIVNLRESTQQENCCNMPKKSDNTSGYKGVWRYRDGVRWQCAIRHMGKTKHLGLFESAKEAHNAYCQAAQKYHGEFARTE